MSSKRAQRRKACTGKARHADAEGAQIAIQKLRKAHGHTGQVNAYRCKHCGFFHIGHAPGRNGLGSGYR